MTNTQSTKTNHYFRALVVVLAMVATMLLTASKPSYAASTFTVNSAADFADINVGDGICDADAAVGNLCTLRAAINESNATAGEDAINFDIPGTGVKTISPQTNLPNIIDPVFIDGFSQPGATPNTLSKGTNAKLMIELNGSGVTGTTESTGLRLSASNCEVRGLVINRFAGGVSIFGERAFLHQNFIGTDPTGTQDRGNSNLGVFDQGLGATIGGNFPQDANLISGNDGAGVSIRSLASQTAVVNNLIGTDKSGTGALGNSEAGVEIDSSSNNFLQSNTIAFNGKDGVSVESGSLRSEAVQANTISANSIFSNGGPGINLVNPNVELPVGETEGSTPNDLGDGDLGPNELQNKPILSAAKTVSGLTTVNGKLNSHANQSYKLEFFSNPSGTNEGKKFIGQKTIFTDGSGNRSFTFSATTKVTVGQTITATATRNSTLDTSEFSAPKKVLSS